ncbi:hypothetical protein C1H46_015567 [Malus baccata]|uniref:Uncharacterized protein n=1 Tax=Malus baccata TaxID=106549 RepID=A0A540MJI4_MALBA|nr:hypothetical protein C1H46_015567 [Malus baccata]
MEDWEEEKVPALLAKDKPIHKWDDEDVDENDITESWEDLDEPAPLVLLFPKLYLLGSFGGSSGYVISSVLRVLHTEIWKLVEEADYKSTKELFSSGGNEKNIDNFIPKSESDFLEYAELISHKLRPFEKSFHYIGLLKAVMRLSMTSLKGADAKEVASSITAIANEKIKAEKEANAGKKKTGAKKKQLIVDKADDDIAVEGYDQLDDYDFM